MLIFSLLAVIAAASLVLVSRYFYNRWKESKLLDHVPTHTFTHGDNSRGRYLSELKPLLESGYRRYNIHGQPFKVPITAGGYAVKYRILLPKDHLEEIKHLSNNSFSWKLASHMIFAGQYTGAPERGTWSGRHTLFSNILDSLFRLLTKCRKGTPHRHTPEYGPNYEAARYPHRRVLCTPSASG